MVYAADAAPLCYEGATLLRNKLDLTSQAELDEYELAVFLTRADEPFPGGKLDYGHYRALRRHLFQDVYDWAGQPRAIRIGKAGNWFCYPEYIDREMKRIFAKLKAAGHLRGLEPDAFAAQAAHVLAEINAVHPFREGNGRTQLAFLALLAENAGLPFNDELLDRDRVLAAMIGSFAGDQAPLAQLVRDLVAPA